MNKVEEFRTAINENEDWQEEVKNFVADDSIVKYAHDKGYEFTEDECNECYKNLDELNEFEMEGVSRGNW